MFHVKAAWQYLCARFDIDAERDDRGFGTAEMAVLVFIGVTAAIVIGGIIIAAARDTATNIPTPDGQ
jgi:hypothetical protein